MSDIRSFFGVVGRSKSCVKAAPPIIKEKAKSAKALAAAAASSSDKAAAVLVPVVKVKAVKAKAPRLPANLDDDEAVEKYNAKVARAKSERENKLVVAASSSSNSTIEGRLETLCANISSIATNVANGDGTAKIESVWVFVNDTDLLGKDAVRVVVARSFEKQRGYVSTADYKIFSSLCSCDDFGMGEDYCMGPSELLQVMMCKH